jgi:hypothetical protein
LATSSGEPALQQSSRDCCFGGRLEGGTEAVDRLSEEAFERLFQAEEAKVDAIRAQIDAVIERDLWPPELYWGGL